MADTAFRKKLAGRDTGVELQIVLEDLLDSWDAKADVVEGKVTLKEGETVSFNERILNIYICK